MSLHAVVSLPESVHFSSNHIVDVVFGSLAAVSFYILMNMLYKFVKPDRIQTTMAQAMVVLEMMLPLISLFIVGGCWMGALMANVSAVNGMVGGVGFDGCIMLWILIFIQLAFGVVCLSWHGNSVSLFVKALKCLILFISLLVSYVIICALDLLALLLFWSFVITSLLFIKWLYSVLVRVGWASDSKENLMEYLTHCVKYELNFFSSPLQLLSLSMWSTKGGACLMAGPSPLVCIIASTSLNLALMYSGIMEGGPYYLTFSRTPSKGVEMASVGVNTPLSVLYVMDDGVVYDKNGVKIGLSKELFQIPRANTFATVKGSSFIPIDAPVESFTFNDHSITKWYVSPHQTAMSMMRGLVCLLSSLCLFLSVGQMRCELKGQSEKTSW